MSDYFHANFIEFKCSIGNKLMNINEYFINDECRNKNDRFGAQWNVTLNA